MNHQLTTNLELELLLNGDELLKLLTTSKHLDGPFGGAYRFDEIATHGWQLADVTLELTEDLLDDALVRLVLNRADVNETCVLGT